MHFSLATIIAALAAGVLATPIPQIGGEAQGCAGILNGLNDGLQTAAGKAGTKRWAVYSRQIAGAANLCYDVVNNIDQGTGYTVGSFLSGAVGDSQDECTGSCAVGNTGSGGGSSGSSGPPPPPPGGPKVRRQGAGALGGAANIENESNDVLTQVGATLGTLESSPTSTLGGDLGNEVYDLTSGVQDKIHNAGGAAPAAPGLKVRQLNKVVTGIHDVGGAFGLGAVVAPVDTVGDDVDTAGTSGVGDLGNQVGNVLDQTLSSA